MIKSITRSSVAVLLAYATVVTAHGYIKNIVVNGVSYQGYDPTTFPYQSNPPVVVGWTTSQTDLGYVDPTAFGAPDIIVSNFRYHQLPALVYLISTRSPIECYSRALKTKHPKELPETPSSTPER